MSAINKQMIYNARLFRFYIIDESVVNVLLLCSTYNKLTIKNLLN